MKIEDIKKTLTEQDYHIDPLGRIVIDNAEILETISGAVMLHANGEDPFMNAGCSNVKC